MVTQMFDRLKKLRDDLGMWRQQRAARTADRNVRERAGAVGLKPAEYTRAAGAIMDHGDQSRYRGRHGERELDAEVAGLKSYREEHGGTWDAAAAAYFGKRPEPETRREVGTGKAGGGSARTAYVERRR